ncbi:putative ATP-dependent helicase DinG [Andreprevotia sp. IGB-42]|uniref:ATP-dependent DNA helicase n=1 Tax=Andreprevotia sp. IGB-42 TaxID=2497473 RepID=UPI001359DB7B|nr:ATP-dependent DNA helicase [Andreprevotia sp. IGB-42]KAF0811465.1 putative ATP-dependent helicase DinG [Andreprevotia sp. IGB-42]
MSYTVAVRELCEFAAKRGDLDLRFTPSPTAQEGMVGHTTVTGRRGSPYQAEITLSGQYRHLLVRGRADGYHPAHNQLEEIKTFRGELARMPDNHRALHWAQAKIYGWLLCAARGLDELNVALVYFDIVSQKETVLREHYSATALHAYFDELCSHFIAWADLQLAHRAERDAALATLGFPHASFRPGQRDLAEAVYKAARTGRCLLAQAPTGIGKTMGTVFPLLKAAPAQKLDKVFYLAAKTSGRALALDALDALGRHAPNQALRVLELIARDKACEHPDKACHGASCPLAQGFYDRLPAARAAALATTPQSVGSAAPPPHPTAAQPMRKLDQTAVRDIALAHQVCPYYLSQELARWADVIIGDYNYYFDSSAMLHGLTVANQWQVGVLVDEAHNLIERARGMYSAELDQRLLKRIRRSAPAALKKPLDKVQRCWSALTREQEALYAVLPALPDKLQFALQQLIGAINDYLGDEPAGLDADLQHFYFDAMQFCRLSETFAAHSLFDSTLLPAQPGKPGAASSVLCIRNVVPAPFLTPRFEATRSTVLFSATLSPVHFYADTLGLPASTVSIDVASPFHADQLSVRVAGGISTRYRDRAGSAEPIAALIATQYRAQPGNYLAFFSSFDYLQQVASALDELQPDIPQFSQSRQMSEAERNAFLARFTASSQGIGFAVLGGAFAEGIDLPGSRLIGAFIATLGLPQLNPVNEQIMQRMETIFGSGYDYTYLYPGLQKVVQAAGRVIRTQADEGVVYLIDDRFQRPAVRSLLPGWWRVGMV